MDRNQWQDLLEKSGVPKDKSSDVAKAIDEGKFTSIPSLLSAPKEEHEKLGLFGEMKEKFFTFLDDIEKKSGFASLGQDKEAERQDGGFIQGVQKNVFGVDDRKEQPQQGGGFLGGGEKREGDGGFLGGEKREEPKKEGGGWFGGGEKDAAPKKEGGWLGGGEKREEPKKEGEGFLGGIIGEKREEPKKEGWLGGEKPVEGEKVIGQQPQPTQEKEDQGKSGGISGAIKTIMDKITGKDKPSSESAEVAK